jgi:hypothetical protein
LKQRLIRKTIDINKKFREDPDKIGAKLMDSFLHRLPYLLFVSLPLFALFLKLVYIRRKQFYYADHGVFTIHLYIFSFILLMVVFGVGKLEALTGNTVTNLLTIALFIWLLIYLYKAMRRFYGQGRIKTIIKYLLVALLSLVMMLVLLFIFLVFSAVTL